MLMGQRDEAVLIARQAMSDAQSVGDEALAVNFMNLPVFVLNNPTANTCIAAEKSRKSAGRPARHGR
jgi:hypothetical protein